MKRTRWAPHEVALLRAMYPQCHTADVAAWIGRSRAGCFNAAFGLGLRKSADYLASDASARGVRGKQDPRLVAHQFRPGHATWNAGRKGWTAGGRSAATRFTKGSVPQTWRPIGTVVLTEDRYLLVKVSDTRNRRKDWRYQHHLAWEAAHGPIPAGHIVVFKRGMHTTDASLLTADRLECIDRAELARRNHPRSRDPELGRLFQLKGAIARQVNRITREAAQHTP